MKTGMYRRGAFAIALMTLAMLSGCDPFTGAAGATGPEGSSSEAFSVTLNPNSANYGLPHKRFNVGMTDSNGKKYKLFFDTFGETHMS
jgi:hypothetical protein